MTLFRHTVVALSPIGILAALALRGPAGEPAMPSPAIPSPSLPIVVTVAYESVPPPAAVNAATRATAPAAACPSRADEPPVISSAKRVFRDAGVPEQFAWIAVVESSLNPKARSRAGAVGLYQLMPKTARELGLRVDRRVDERYNVDRNTRAAARYLAGLHQRFGSWRLALAAYNAGPTRVARLLRRHRTASYNVIAPHLPRETRAYVPKVFAVISQHEGADTYPPSDQTVALAPSSQSAL